MRMLLPLLPLIALPVWTAFSQESDDSPAQGIQDNSFLLEEAYNQDPGVVQHIFNFSGSFDRMHGGDDRTWTLAFTQEWPVFSQTHQFSYTVPYTWSEIGGVTENGIEDIFINYRFQLSTENATRPAVAPRISLILPTGDEEKGLGNDTLGYQFNLPVSKIVSDRVTLHFNAGLTFLPDVRGRDLTSYNLGASAIYALSRDFNLMVEGVASWDEEVDELGGRDRTFSAIVSPGFRYAVNFKNDSQMVVGLAAPIGLNSDAPDFGVFVYFSFEHAFHRPKMTAVESRALRGK